MKEFDGKTLSSSNGKDGNPSYIAYEGKVYDVSESQRWTGGIHMNRHEAGKDLTTDIQAAPHGPEVLERYPEIGTLTKEIEIDMPMPKALSRFLARFPFFRRHPHPMTVHFPIVFMFSVTLFNLLYLLTGVKSFESTALHCLGGGILFMPVAMLTGWFAWWLNFMAKPMRATNIKVPLSFVLLALSLAAFIWRIVEPNVLDSLDTGGVIYLLIVLSFIPLVTIISWFGAMLTSPLEKS
jgi:predicted heme/steroid binding protein/uncharacterized membrane protein